MKMSRIFLSLVIIGFVVSLVGCNSGKVSVESPDEVNKHKQEMPEVIDNSESENSVKKERKNFKAISYNPLIGKKRITCLDNSNIFEIFQCEVDAANSWENEINKNLSFFKKNFNENTYKYINANQALWQEYENSTENIVNNVVISKQGNINKQIGYGYIANLKKNRSEFLRALYNGSEFYDDSAEYRTDFEIKDFDIDDINVFMSDYMNDGSNKDYLIAIKDELRTVANKYSHFIDKAEAKCIVIADNSVSQQIDCSYRTQVAWNNQIKKYLSQLKRRLGKNEFLVISKNQELWEKSLNDDKVLVKNLNKSSDGLIPELIGENLIKDVYKERALFLRNLYNQYYKQ